MQNLALGDKERILVIEVLEAYLATLPHEIHQTDRREYREMLEDKQSTLQQILKQLQKP